MAGPLDQVHAILSLLSRVESASVSFPPCPVGSSQMPRSATHPKSGSQAPVPHGGSQASGGPPVHVPEASHWSAVVHASPSLQVVPTGLGVPLQVPPPQLSVVHWLPSSQGAVLCRCRQTPRPSPRSSVQSFPSVAQPVPEPSNWQVVGLQQSPAPVSSHCSEGSRTPLPHRVPEIVPGTGIPGVPNRQVSEPEKV